MIHTDNTDPKTTLGNIYTMTNVAARRVYQLRRGHAAKVSPEPTMFTTALKEIQEGHIGLEILLQDDKRKK